MYVELCDMTIRTGRLEDTEGLLSSGNVLGGLMSDDVEPDGLGKGTALADGDNVSFLNVEGRRAVHGNVLVTLLETTVLSDVVKVIPAHNDGVLHLCGDDDTLQDTAADRDIASEGTLFVDVVALDGGGGGLDPKTDGTDEAHRLLTAVADRALSSDEDGILALVGLFVLVALDVLLGKARHISKNPLKIRRNRTSLYHVVFGESWRQWLIEYVRYCLVSSSDDACQKENGP